MPTTLLRSYYDYYIHEISDVRVKNWALMRTPGPLMLVVLIYLVGVLFLLPKYMEKRTAYSLKTTIYWYNIFQVFACSYLIYGIATSGWTTHYTFGCQPLDLSTSPMALRMLHFVYLTLLLKVCELIETVFFILRKKFNQVSKLHLYHHTSTLILAWIAVKYMASGMATFPIMVNCGVHILMYTYYLLASLGPQWQRRLNKWKPRLTMLQMVQFCILILHALQAIKKDCNFPSFILYWYVPNVFTVFYLFFDFYKSSYGNKKIMKLQ